MSCEISGQGKDEAAGHQNFPYISNDTSLLKLFISFCCFPKKRQTKAGATLLN